MQVKPLCIGLIIVPAKGNIQSTFIIDFKKNEYKRNAQTWGVHYVQLSPETAFFQFLMNVILTNSMDWNRATNYNNNQSEESKQKKLG